ncbi:sensor histidine kinase [Sphingomonas azotifigens]|uniref:sensor histidine kinase n=1 Tax=Sphingomonas azotifigens TaxID=330920 RepID=UPI0009FF13B1|nr:ATP-binding protein [Sphingomonas azotifigens]
MPRRRLRSLGTIAIGFALALSAAIALAGIGVYVALIDVIDRQVDLRLQAEAHELLEGTPGPALLASRIARESSERESADIGFLLRDAKGATIAGNIAPTHSLPLGFSTVHHDAGISGLSRGRAWKTQLADGGTLALVAESEPIERHDRNRLRILAIGFGAVVALLLLGTVALIRAIGTNIAAIASAADAISHGDLRARVPVDQPRSAFGGLAVTFNRMLDRIGELVASMRGISNDVAHDLRTPLARLHGRLAALAADPAAAPVRHELEAAVAESDEILAIFAAILRISEIEAGQRQAGFETFDLAALAADIAEGLQLMVTESDRAFVAPTAREPVIVEGDPRLFTQAIVNLIENAVTHTPPGTTIRLDVQRDGTSALLVVEDDGPGIPPNEHERALRRFGRLDASRHTRGHGLGLPLAVAVARMHRGSLALQDAQPGLRVALRLSLAPGCSS